MMTREPELATLYKYSVAWSAEDEEYVATVAEFPSLSWLADSQEMALSGMLDLVRTTVSDMSDSGENVPVPFASREYSGNIRLRVSPQKHRDLSIKASEQGVSLNRYLNEQLSNC